MFANVLFKIKQIGVIFIQPRLWVAVAKHNLELVIIYIIQPSASRVTTEKDRALLLLQPEAEDMLDQRRRVGPVMAGAVQAPHFGCRRSSTLITSE